jgi:hypothetical protein
MEFKKQFPKSASYAEWNAMGRRICRGEQARRIENGIPLFDLIQTYDPTLSGLVFFTDLHESEDMPH